MTEYCLLFTIRHSVHTPYSRWTIGLVETENHNFHPQVHFLKDPPKDCSTQTQKVADAHRATAVSDNKLSAYQIVLQTYPRKTLTYELNITRNSFKTCTSAY